MTPEEKMQKQNNTPITLADIDNDLSKRVEKIEKEFKDGFNLIKRHPRSITFFGSARTGENEEDYIKTKRLAGRIQTELGYAVITGGGPGIMGAANQGSFEAGGDSIGLTINLPAEQITNKYLTEHMDFYYFFARKVCLSFSAEAYVFLPGGFGTLDELFEILTLIQTNKVVKVPIILYGKKFWKDVDKLIKKKLLRAGKIDQTDIDLYIITDSEDEIIEIIKNSPIRDRAR